MVADLVSELIGRWPQVATIEFAVEDVPPSNPAAWESHNVVVARIFPADRRRGLREGGRRGVWLGRSWDSGSLGVSCGWSATSRSCTSGPMWRMRARGVCVMRMSSARTFALGEVLERTRMRNMFLTW